MWQKIANCKGFQASVGSLMTSLMLWSAGSITTQVFLNALLTAVVAAIVCIGYQVKVYEDESR
jgi:hypothetical protein